MANQNGVLVQSVARALEILELFQKSRTLGISDIAEAMELSKSTIYGLVNTLVTFGYLEQESETKKYRLGMKLFELGTTVEQRMDLRREARPFCEDIAKRYGQTVHLATHWEGEVVYIDKFDQPDFLISYSQVGKRAPMSCTGVGKALLAYLPLSYLEQYVFSKPLPQKTSHSLSTKEALLENLEEVRRRGYAVDDEEIELGLRCVAAPIFNHQGQPVAAVSLSGMVNKMTPEVLASLAVDLVACAAAISAQLGYQKS